MAEANSHFEDFFQRALPKISHESLDGIVDAIPSPLRPVSVPAMELKPSGTESSFRLRYLLHGFRVSFKNFTGWNQARELFFEFRLQKMKGSLGGADLLNIFLTNPFAFESRGIF